jgi:hypothetical protein
VVEKEEVMSKQKENQELEQKQGVGQMGAPRPLPAHLVREPGVPAAGTENMERQDMTLPRLGLCQSLSPQRLKSNAKYIPGLEEGQFFNTITQEIYGTKVMVIPLLFYKNRIRFKPMETGGGMLCQAIDAMHGVGDPGIDCMKCTLKDFVDNKPPECDMFFNYASLVVLNDRVDPSGLLVASFKSSGLRIAKDWNALIRIKNLDMFGGFYNLESYETTKDKYTWFAPKVTAAGLVENPAMYEAAKIAYNAVSQLNREGRLRTDVDDLHEEEQTAEQTKEM